MKHLWKLAVVGSLLFVAAGCGTSSEAEEKTEEVSILTAVLAEDPKRIKNESSGEDYLWVSLKDMVKLQGEFNPNVLIIPNLDFHQITGDYTELAEGTRVRLVTPLRPITLRSYPGQMLGHDVKEFTILD